MHTALTIAGSDSSGGAGVQADLKTMLANGVFGESVITALTAQNTMGVDAVMNVPADFIEAQMKAVFTDIFPDAVKIGMTSSVDTIEAIAAGLVKYNAKNIVLDPVMVATSAMPLLMRQVYYPSDPQTAGKILELLDKMFGNVSFYAMKCDISEEAVRCSFETMTGEESRKE